MTIEQRVNLLYIPVPIIVTDVKPGTELWLRFKLNRIGFPSSPSSIARVMDTDRVMIQDLETGESEIFCKEEINKRRIKSDRIPIFAAGTYSLRWRQTVYPVGMI